MSAFSLIGLLQAQVAARGTAVAIQRKKRGLWQSVTWAELAERVDRFAGGLSRSGVAAGDAVAIIGDASPEWIIADLAVARIGGRSVAIPAQTPGPTILRLLADANVSAIVAGDQEQVDLVASSSAADDVLLVVIDPRGIKGGSEHLTTFADISDLPGDNSFDDALAAQSIITMFTEDGPDGPEAIHHPAAAVAELAGAAAGWLGLTHRDSTLSVLSPAVPTARVFDIYAALAAGCRIAIPESPATVLTDLVEFGPTYLTLSPRALQLLRLSSDRRARSSSRSRRALIRWALHRSAARLDRRPPTLAAPPGPAPESILVGDAIRRKLGLRRTRTIIVVDAPVSSADVRFMWSLRVPVLMTFGGADFAGAALSTSGLADTFGLGDPLPGSEVRVSGDHTLELRTPVTGGQWRPSGEVVHQDGSGSRVRQGRRADWLNLPSGPRSQTDIEQILLESGFIDRCVVTVGPGGGLVVVVEPEPVATGDWATEHKVHFSTHQSLVTASEVVTMIDAEARQRISTLNGVDRLPPVEKVIVLDRPLTISAGDLTTLLNIRRKPVLQSLQLT